MGNFTRTYPDDVWNGAGFVVPPAALADLESKLRRGINGDGGAYAPSSPITIAGAGLTASPVVVRGNGRIRVTSSGTFPVRSGWPRLGSNHTGRTRTRITPCVFGQSLPTAMTFVRRDLCASQFFASQFLVGSGAGSTLQAQLYVPLRVHDGATITQATLTFAIAQPHPSPPLKTVTMRVLRVDRNGNKTPLTSAAAGGDQYGFIPYAPFPSSGGGWFDGGAVKSLVVACDQNNVVDVSQYTYYAHIVDEQGLTERPFTAIILPPVDSVSRFGNFDLTATSGYGRAAGGRYLLVSQKSPAENGIWTWQPDPDHFPDPPTGKYVRYPDAAIGDPHPVLAQTGQAYWTGYGTWYCAAGLPKDFGQPLLWTVEPSQSAGGNIFHAVAVKHEGISQMGFA